MKQFGKIMLIVLSLGILATGLSSIPSRPIAAAGGAPVTVLNTPLPVQGTVGVSNFPAIQAVSGTVAVSNFPAFPSTLTGSTVPVSGTVNANVTFPNSVAVTSPLDGKGNPTPLAVLDATQPYEDKCTITFGGLAVAICNFQAIPSGKRLVVQEFDTSGAVETGLKPEAIEVVLAAATEFFPVHHYFPATFMGSSGGADYFASHQETHMYSPASNTPTCQVFLTDVSSGSWACVLSGFLVDAP